MLPPAKEQQADWECVRDVCKERVAADESIESSAAAHVDTAQSGNNRPCEDSGVDGHLQGGMDLIKPGRIVSTFCAGNSRSY